MTITSHLAAASSVRPAGRLAFGLAVLCAASLGAPAIAVDDPPIGSRLGKRVDRQSNSRYDDQDSRRSAMEIARCIYTRRPASVDAFLTAKDSAASERAYRAMWDRARCNTVTVMGGAMAEGLSINAPIDIMRGNFAEAALQTKLPGAVLPPLPAPAPADTNYVRDWFAISGRDATVNEMAVCVAERNPDGIRTLIATKAEAPEEKAAVQALAPSLGPCLPQGATLKANRQSLRAALADALYQRATTPARLVVQ